jgi:hypothetical protein
MKSNTDTQRGASPQRWAGDFHWCEGPPMRTTARPFGCGCRWGQCASHATL